MVIRKVMGSQASGIGIILVTISFMAVSYHLLRLSLVNPAEMIRQE